MSNVLRSTTFQLEFNGAEGITGVKTFTKAVRDADAFVAELSQTLGKNVAVTYKTTQTKAEAAKMARALAEQMERSAQKTEKLTAQYKRLGEMVNKTSDEIEQMNAVAALGSNATEAQKQQVLAAVRNYQALRDGVEGSTGSLRNFRGMAQNAGWQLQDTVVQLQAGTSAFVVFSQQGSQLASAFGPTGAIVGAIIALSGVAGGVLFSSLNSAADAMERLDKATENYQKYLTPNIEGTTTLTDKMESLAYYSHQAAEGMLEISRLKVLEAQSEAVKAIGNELENIVPFAGNLREALGLGNVQNVVEFQRAFRALRTEVNQYTLDEFLEAVLLINPSAKEAEKGTLALKEKLIELYGQMSEGLKILDDSAKGFKPMSKEARNAADAIKDIIKAFEAEYLALVKQTESTEEEYQRRKKVIDAYVLHIGSTNEKAKAAYAALDQWKAKELDKEFQTFYKSLVKKTNTVEQEYQRQKAIIDDHVKRVGSVDTQAAEAYANLEKWKTDQYQKEYDKRERIRREIEKAQIKVRRGDDPIGAEKDVFASNQAKLTEQLNQLAEDQYKERARINKLMEDEIIRHNSEMQRLELEQVQSQVAIFSLASQQLVALADLMATGANDVKTKTQEMNDFQKTMFVISQMIAASMAFINGISLGMKLAEMFPLLAPQMIATGTALGAAQAGAIMGVTIAGAFDEGGNIPVGQAGIVSEYGDELVNGVLVKGPARVTSREETAELLNGNGNSVSLKVNIENNIQGAAFEVQQISAEEVKIIATQVFNKNIDSGVSRTLSDRNSKATKAIRSNFTTTSKV